MSTAARQNIVVQPIPKNPIHINIYMYNNRRQQWWQGSGRFATNNNDFGEIREYIRDTQVTGTQ